MLWNDDDGDDDDDDDDAYEATIQSVTKGDTGSMNG